MANADGDDAVVLLSVSHVNVLRRLSVHPASKSPLPSARALCVYKIINPGGIDCCTKNVFGCFWFSFSQNLVTSQRQIARTKESPNSRKWPLSSLLAPRSKDLRIVASFFIIDAHRCLDITFNFVLVVQKCNSMVYPIVLLAHFDLCFRQLEEDEKVSGLEARLARCIKHQIYINELLLLFLKFHIARERKF
jgi:hypothetical protein